MSRQDIIENRKNKFLNMGREKGLSNDLLSSDKLFVSNVGKLIDFKNKITRNKIYFLITIFIIIFLLTLLYQYL